MATGLWARNRAACDALARGQGDPDFIFDGKQMLGPQDYYNVTPFKPLGDGRYQTGGEDERQVIDMNDPKFILVQEGNGWSGGYTWCSSRSEEHTSALQSLMRISYAVFCLKKKRTNH